MKEEGEDDEGWRGGEKDERILNQINIIIIF